MHVRYAAYGSNLHPERLVRRVPSARLIGTSVVHGWGLRFNKTGHDGSAKCNIIAAAEQVHFAIYELRATERGILDRIEGLNLGYEGASLDVPGFGDCFLYRASDSHVDDVLSPFSWYKELVLAGCELHGFPTEYVAGIRRIAHEIDADIERHNEHMGIVSAARQHTRSRNNDRERTK